MSKKTKVMPSSPSNSKHKLRKCNVMGKKILKGREKNKHREKILIGKLKNVDPK